MDNGKYRSSDIKQRCIKKLRINFRNSGGEDNGWVEVDGARVGRITIPRGRKPVPAGTYHSMAKQRKLTVRQFDDLLGCRMDFGSYSNIVLRE